MCVREREREREGVALSVCAYICVLERERERKRRSCIVCEYVITYSSLVRTCGLFSPNQHVVSGGMKHEAAGSGYLRNGTVGALCRGLGVVKELNLAVSATRGKHRDSRMEVQSHNSLHRGDSLNQCTVVHAAIINSYY